MVRKLLTTERLAAWSLVVVLVIFWETGARLSLWRPWLFPAPSTVFETLKAGFMDGSLPLSIRVSLVRLISAFAIALIAGGLIGLTLGAVPTLRSAFAPLLSGLQTLPSICWQPLAILWFGLSERAILFVTLMGAAVAIIIAVTDGVVSINPLTIRAAQMMGVRGFALWIRVLLPASLPAFAAGAKQGWAYGWRSLMAAELLSVSAGSVGLGLALKRGRDINNMSQVLAIMFVLIAIGVIADKMLFTRLNKYIQKSFGLEEAH
ncbi:MAG: ABC transporter permease [Chthonomonadales bacterium]